MESIKETPGQLTSPAVFLLCRIQTARLIWIRVLNHATQKPERYASLLHSMLSTGRAKIAPARKENTHHIHQGKDTNSCFSSVNLNCSKFYFHK